MPDAKTTSRGNVWSAIDIAPTADLGALRRNFASRDVPESRVEERRAAYETALPWLTLGLPPERLDGWDAEAEAVVESFQSIVGAANEGFSPPSGTECARAFWLSGSFPAETRADAVALHPYLKAFATTIERDGSPEETLQALVDLFEAPALRRAEIKRDRSSSNER